MGAAVSKKEHVQALLSCPVFDCQPSGSEARPRPLFRSHLRFSDSTSRTLSVVYERVIFLPRHRIRERTWHSLATHKKKPEIATASIFWSTHFSTEGLKDL